MTLGEFKEWLKDYASIETRYRLSYYDEITKSNSYGIYNYTFICRFNSKLINIECYPKRKKCKIYPKYYINQNPIEIPEDLKQYIIEKLGYTLIK